MFLRNGDSGIERIEKKLDDKTKEMLSLLNKINTKLDTIINPQQAPKHPQDQPSAAAAVPPSKTTAIVETPPNSGERQEAIKMTPEQHYIFNDALARGLSREKAIKFAMD